jgi:hypothetical protein
MHDIVCCVYAGFSVLYYRLFLSHDGVHCRSDLRLLLLLLLPEGRQRLGHLLPRLHHPSMPNVSSINVLSINVPSTSPTPPIPGGLLRMHPCLLQELIPTPPSGALSLSQYYAVCAPRLEDLALPLGQLPTPQNRGHSLAGGRTFDGVYDKCFDACTFSRFRFTRTFPRSY